MIGALLAGGVPPWFMVAHSRGESFEGLFDATGRPASEADRAAGARFELERTWPPIGPGSWQLALRTLARPRRYPPAAIGAGWLPRGFISTESLKDQIRRVVPEGWGPHPNLWIMACDYATGRRVAFGRPESPTADARRRGRRLLRDPRLLLPGRDRRPPLRRRRHVLDLEPRRRPQRGARPRHLPQPDLLPAPEPGLEPVRVDPRRRPAAGSAARRRSCARSAPRSS